jgi:restriction system protein
VGGENQMANITARRTGEFLRKVFDVLWDKPDGLPARDVLDYVAKNSTLTEYESGSYESSPQDRRVDKIIRFATVDLVKAGWMVKSKGRWILTDTGKDAYKRFKDPELFYREAARLYHAWKKSSLKSSAPETFKEEPVKEYLAFEEAEENAWDQIQKFLLSKNPYEFQNLVADLLNAMNYHVAWISPPGKDRGIDIIAYNDPLGTTTPRIKVQVKQRDSAISVEGLRAFMSILGTDDVGIFVSTGGFTADAREEARTQERRKITLLDLSQFYDLWVQYYNKLSQDARQHFPLKPVYYLDLEE